MKEIIKKFESLEGKKKLHEIFTDFFEISTICIRLATLKLGLVTKEETEGLKDLTDRFEHIRAGYTEEEYKKLDSIFTDLVKIMDNNVQTKGYVDIISQLYHELGQHSASMGQFFTPTSVAHLTGCMVTPGEKLLKEYEEHGRIKLCDPACGAGALLIRAVDNAVKLGIPLEAIDVYGQDLSKDSCNMAYVQLSIYGINAKITQQNTLTLEKFDEFVTPTMKIKQTSDYLRRL